MVEPSKPLAATAAVQGLAALFAGIQSDTCYHGLLQRLVECAPAATGAAGVAFYERCSTGARVVAAVGVFDWMRGLPVSDPADVIPAWSEGPLVSAFDWSALGPNARLRMADEGLRGVVRAAVVSEGRHVGCFALGYTDGLPREGSTQYVSIALLSACAAGMFSRPGAGRGAGGMASGREGGATDEDNNLSIAVTSHALRTPTTVIRGYADTLAERWDQLDDGARRSAVSIIRQRGRDLGRLLDRLLIAAGDGLGPGAAAVGVPFDLLEALQISVEELPADLRGDVRLRLPRTLPKAFGDRGSIAIIVTELVTNADKNSPDWADIELTAGSDGRTVWLAVSDRGVGIRPEHVERAFERFWQSDHDGRPRRGGVGLGLYLVRRVVERHEGWVSLRPRERGGTIAEVRLPRADTMVGGV